MKKATPGARESLDADGGNLRVSSPTTFRITACTPVNFGGKRAEIVLEIEGVGLLHIDYFRPRNGGAPFVAPKSIRSRFSGAWERTFRLDDDLATAILEAVESRLSAEDDGTR